MKVRPIVIKMIRDIICEGSTQTCQMISEE